MRRTFLAETVKMFKMGVQLRKLSQNKAGVPLFVPF